ncbi:MAG: ornithine carbamoyltransferase [Candidatus Saganbacteria bacterium]|nr:ornithine carbamoyltransferase [Candidatus Saganbacteria bacterium]
MTSKLKGRDLASISDLSYAEIKEIYLLAAKLKKELKTGKNHKPYLKGKSIALVFEKPSNRTRVSFDVGIYQLGGHPVVLMPDEIQLGLRESVADVARTLSRFVDGIVVRTFAHKSVEELAKHASVPVINGLSDQEHPCQALADFFTILEKKRTFKGLKIAYVGDGNNVCYSLMLLAEQIGVKMSVATPKGYEPRALGAIQIVNDPREAVKDADVIYTDVWASMGQEKEAAEKKLKFKDFQVNAKLLSLAKKDALVMHCLPAHRDEEITDDVLEGKQSVVFDQAENRLHVQKAILVKLLS